jgi:hypothetical protein
MVSSLKIYKKKEEFHVVIDQHIQRIRYLLCPNKRERKKIVLPRFLPPPSLPRAFSLPSID